MTCRQDSSPSHPSLEDHRRTFILALLEVSENTHTCRDHPEQDEQCGEQPPDQLKSVKIAVAARAQTFGTETPTGPAATKVEQHHEGDERHPNGGSDESDNKSAQCDHTAQITVVPNSCTVFSTPCRVRPITDWRL